MANLLGVKMEAAAMKSNDAASGSDDHTAMKSSTDSVT